VELELALSLAEILSSLLFLLVLGLEDLKTRELNSRLVYSYLAIAVVFYVLTLTTSRSLIESLVYTAFTLLVTPGVFLVLYKYKLTGDGDVYVSLALGLSIFHPLAYKATLVRCGVISPALVSVLYASLTATLYTVIQGIINMVIHREILDQVPAKYRAIVALAARPVRVSDYIENQRYKHYYPVQEFKLSKQGLVVEFHLGGLNESSKQSLLELVEKGFVPRDQFIWVTQGIPYIFYMFIGLVLLVLIGDKPLYYILVKLIGY
jgi:prepilin signal peptidase PulO-like enzyme (type II secretory pathway)